MLKKLEARKARTLKSCPPEKNTTIKPENLTGDPPNASNILSNTKVDGNFKSYASICIQGTTGMKISN